MAGLCDQKNCSDCDCPAIVALALRGRVESPSELRHLSGLPADIQELITDTARCVADRSKEVETCHVTDHELPIFISKQALQSGSDDEL